jgi:2-keto-3-deoxy-L-arabinonate dehydratase
MLTHDLRGCIPIVLTPFRDDGGIDMDSLERQVEFIISSDVHGLATPALASEGFKLTDSERDGLIEAVVRMVGGRLPVVASADGAGVAPAIERAQAAVEAGADALMVLPPSFVKPDAQHLEEYFGRVAEAAGIPIMIQDAPQLTGVAISVDMLARLHEAHPLISSVKLEGIPSAVKSSEVLTRLGGRMTVFSGWGGLAFFEGLQRGASGCMPAANLGFALAEVYRLFAGGEQDEAALQFDRLVPFMSWSMQTLDLGTWCAKEMLTRAGIISSARMREPFTPPDDRQIAEFNRLVSSVPWPDANA